MIFANLEHYICMVNLLHCVGHLQEAKKWWPHKPHVNPWKALPSTCRIHGNLENVLLNKLLNWSLKMLKVICCF
jgi:hypothetical protein